MPKVSRQEIKEQKLEKEQTRWAIIFRFQWYDRAGEKS